MENNMQTVMIDGTIIDVSKLSKEELNEMQKNLKLKRDELRKKINEMLDEK